ncbi:restriction endonuclease subunit S [Cereibacter changlensis]|uniref:Restriction endonuclease subunit S n=2 Tax=Cereibacter changlensis TaxID=402884 RepID=A0A4U0YVL4_9RHOB|nr:restriction endonuclease subunit S [Cereibacter changlensis]
MEDLTPGTRYVLSSRNRVFSSGGAKFVSGDILFARITPCLENGKIAQVRLSKVSGFGSTEFFVFRAKPNIADAAFVFYLCTTSWVRAPAEKSMAGASGRQRADMASVLSAEVPLPSLPTQKRIAAILSAYDDLIENNTRRITILEEMARRLYEEWFVHFRFPGHEAAEFRTSDAGDTPAGWPISRLEDLVQINPRTSVPSDGFKPFVPMGSLSETNMVVGPVEQREGNSGTKFQNNDTLVARITPCLENGKTGFVDFLTGDQPVGFGSTEFIVLRPAVLGRCAIYCLARSHAFRDVAIKSMSGSEGRQRVQPDSVKAFLVARPPTTLLDRFEDFAWPCFQQVSALAKKNANLRAQRDMLLPKLISGEIDFTYTLEAAKEAAE